ncbi:hypothetical protein [Streptomyces sp. NPDC086835]|uniref:hypothetical protein n=1 Tax=Streptomyces sp. NPDC086835 TaxID=3365761 RepID=UPI0038213027
MSPRPGGETDKFGNRYEGAWTVRHLLYVLLGSAQSITVEDPDPERERGAEFTYRRSTVEEVHQLKRQNRNVNNWSVASLQEKGIWEDAHWHIKAGRQFHFVSTLPAKPLQELTDRVRRSRDLKSFLEQWLTEELRDPFDQLSSETIFGSAETAWDVLQGFWISWPDEQDLIKMNAALAELLLDGSSGLSAALTLGDLVQHNLGVELDCAAIESRLDQYGLRRSSRHRAETFTEKVTSITAGWVSSVGRELLCPVIPRSELLSLEEVTSGPDKLILLMGSAGGGKSAVLHQFCSSIDSSQTPVLAFRLDRLDPFSTTTELGQRIGLDASPVTALASLAGERASVLVVDQVDAVSLASGRMPRNFDAVANLVREAEAFPNMRIVLACRKFDVQNDYRIRELVDKERCAHIEVPDLTDEQVNSAIATMGLLSGEVNAHQRKLLRSPLNLVLLSNICDDSSALSFRTTKQLFDSFWRRKLTDCVQRKETVRFEKVISTLTEAVSRRQRLSVSVTVLDAENLAVDAGILISERVLVQDGQQIAFFHESFFDYAFARRWIDGHESVVDFLLDGEQELFRRAQVRQVLNHLREEDPERFVNDVESVLTHSEVRFHIKDVVLALLVALLDPTPHEWEMVERVLATHPPFAERLRRSLRTAPWFERIDAEGVVEGWLAGSDKEEHSLALETMAGAARINPDRLAEILGAHKTSNHYQTWLLGIVQVAELHNSRSLFNLLLEAVRNGVYAEAASALWISAHGLADQQPSWAIELLNAHLAERPGCMVVDGNGKVVALLDRDYSANQLMEVGAARAPQQFCELLLPYMLRVMSATAIRGAANQPVLDRQFSYRFPGTGNHELEDSILAGAVSAIRAVVLHDPVAAVPTLRMLATDSHDTAQWLLYEGLKAAGDTHARWAGELLLEGVQRLISGYPTSNLVWQTRELLLATSSFMPDEVFNQLEGLILHVRFPWEDGRSSGWHQFNLLSALDEVRISEVGRRRLAELRRRHGADHPAEPQGITGGFLGPPISLTAAERMSDAQWLRAIAKHHDDRRDWEKLTGGASEQASVLKEQTKRDPARFARLALEFSEATNSAYGNAVLMGLAEAEPLSDASPVFAAVRHIASLGNHDNDRWLGTGLRMYLQEVPEDLLEILIDRALSSTDPEDGTRAIRTSNQENTEARDIWTSGFNTARGSLAETLGDILVYDADGSRTSLVLPSMLRLAVDPAVTVRACAAHLIHASMRHARSEALAAFWELIEAEDALLATRPVVRLMVYIGKDDVALIRPVIDRMLASSEYEVREVGGQLSAVAAAQWGALDALELVVAGNDVAARRGAASVCAHQLAEAPNSTVIRRAFSQFVRDSEMDVRKAIAEFAPAIRGARMRPLRGPIQELIDSPAFDEALTQLLITLQHAPDRVDDLALACAERFVEVNGPDAADVRTGAAADARYIGELVVRAYAQSGSVSARRKALDILDNLLLIGAFGVAELILNAER